MTQNLPTTLLRTLTLSAVLALAACGGGGGGGGGYRSRENSGW